MSKLSLQFYYLLVIVLGATSQILPRLAHAEVLPASLTRSERRFVAPYFSTAYSQLVSTRPYFLGNYPGLEIGGSVSYKGLSDIQNEHPEDELRDELLMTQLFIKKSLVKRLEIVFSSTLSSFGTSQVSGFGGMLSWHPLTIEDSRYLPSFSIFTNYMNYEDSLTFQESGVLVAVGQNFKKFSLNLGVSLSQMNAMFSGKSSGREITDTGLSEREKLFLQTGFVSLIVNYENYLMTFVQNYTLDGGFEPGVIISYQF